MRRWLEYPTASHRGWLRGLQDPKIATALQLMHDMPAHEWSVQKLANAAGMSRSKFAARFADLIGEPPLKYLTSWRMVLAAQALESAPDRPLIDIAQSVGYQTEASFSVWFKRQFGKPPGAWRKDSSLQTSVRQKVS
ncbi:MAG: AraC family transcriptional regulator [Rhizobiaceae bacterium]